MEMEDENKRLDNIMPSIIRRDRNSKPIELSTFVLDVGISTTKYNYYH